MHTWIFEGCPQTFYDTNNPKHTPTLMLINYKTREIKLGFIFFFTLKNIYVINSIHFFSFEGEARQFLIHKRYE
jgi:hypothetical protein